MTTNLHSREKDKRSKAPHIPGDKCWQDFMAYLEAPTDGNGKADRLVCKLDRDLADSLDDCDIRGPLPFRPRERHHPLVLREPPSLLAQYRREKKSLFNNYNPESHA